MGIDMLIFYWGISILVMCFFMARNQHHPQPQTSKFHKWSRSCLMLWHKWHHFVNRPPDCSCLGLLVLSNSWLLCAPTNAIKLVFSSCEKFGALSAFFLSGMVATTVTVLSRVSSSLSSLDSCTQDFKCPNGTPNLNQTSTEKKGTLHSSRMN